MPSFIGNLSFHFQILTLGANLFLGNIPVGIGNLVNLGFEGNSLSGSVPEVKEKLNKLEELEMNSNELSGSIPSSLW